MADDDPWLLKEEGYLYVDTECKSIVYHPNLNVLLITTGSGQVYVFDVNFGVVLQRSSLSGRSDGKLQGVYLAEGVDKVLYTDGRGIGVRSDYNGVLLLDTILQTPVTRGEDVIKMEILLSEAILLNQCLRLVTVPGVEHVQQVLQELSSKIHAAQGTQKKGIKAQKWNTICLELPHAALKLVCSGLVAELQKQNKHIPALPIASAINERLNGLLRGLTFEGGPADRALMFSEAARRKTFSTWPHMSYKWALPGQMAQAGFYYAPNSTADDRAMCFTCNVCLVCWEPTDEPWSEHERHLPTCPFVKGEYTQNVPLSVTLATAPARESSESVDVIGTTNVAGLIATASHKGLVTVWNISNQLKGEVSFCVASRGHEANNKDSIQFFAARNLSSAYLSNLSTDSDQLVEYETPKSQTINLTALSIIRGPKPELDDSKTSLASTMNQQSSAASESPESLIRPCLICGVSVTTSSIGSIGMSGSSSSSGNTSNLRTLENVWAATSDLAPSSSLVRAMNSVNSAASDSLDIMKVAGGRTSSSSILKNHYLVIYDFHHKAPTPQPSKDETSKSGKAKKSLSGTGTSASSNGGGRSESLYQDMYMSKFLYEVPVIEDVDCEMVGGTHFDGIFQNATLPTSSSNALYHSTSFAMTQSPYDANFNAVNAFEQFPSTSDITNMNKKTLEMTKSTRTDPVVVQTLCIEAASSLTTSWLSPTRDGRHLYVALTPVCSETSSTSNTNSMDVDEESDIFSPKSLESLERMYWDHNGAAAPEVKLINGEIHNEPANPSALLLVYALDFTGKTVKLVPEPVTRRELPADQAPVEHVLLPLQEKHRVHTDGETASSREQPKGQIALVCKDGIVRILDVSGLKTITEARPNDPATKFISAAYCNGLERLCVCSSDGDLNFFATNEEDESAEEKDDPDDVNMVTEAQLGSANNENEEPGPSSSSAAFQEPVLAHRTNLTHGDLRNIYELTRFDRHSPAYGATVPSCWNEMMQAQRQRCHPQHLHQSEDQHHTRTWRLQNDATTWDEHIFELTLPRTAAGSVGHVDVRFSLHWPCLELPTIQVTLLKQKIAGPGHHKSPLTPVDERIDFSLDSEQKGENPIISEEYQRQHNTEILCGPINLQRCTDLSDHSGCVTLTSPKLFGAKARTLLVHIKALIDPAKDGATSKSRINLLETKPPTSKKLRIDEAGPLLPGATVERIAASANKKLECYIGCDWIHELSITVRSVQPTNIPNERLQRCAMLESTAFIENLLNVACLQGVDKTLVAQSLALDILIWVVAIRMTRLRVGQNTTETRLMQLNTVRAVQGKLDPLLRTCLLHAGRSIAHKCVKLIVLCSEGLHNTDDPAPHSFDEAVLAVLVTLLPSVVSVQWAGSLRWLALLITRLLPLDRNHAVAQQCVAIVQQIAAEMSNRVNPYHLLLATRFGLYNSPFETELFDIEPPMPPKSSSTLLTYATMLAGEQATSTATTNTYTQDTIDLRDLLTLPTHSSGELIVPSKLKALSTNHSIRGLLEVEPLHFTCHAASDGTKMEKIDPGANAVNMGTTLVDTTVTTNNFMTEFKTGHQNAYNLDAGSLVPDLRAKIRGKLSDLITQYEAEMTKKPVAQLSITPDDQSDSDEPNNMTGDTQIWHSEQNDTANSHTLTSTVTKEKSTITNIGAGGHKIEDNGVKKREDVTFPWGRLLCWPPQQALVVERMHSGGRRFVVLDFGSPILLTDLMIPSCSDLVSLSIDIWTKSEEMDGTRLVVAGDIGTKLLVVKDLQPPPVCRYLKITMIGRYGMTATRCRIPLGMFYGHMVGLPGEDYSEPTSSQSNIIGNTDSTLQATIDTQCSILSALVEDVQCRFSLATERLKSLLDPLLCTETPNVMHMQHYLNRSKNSSENKEQPSARILSTYRECLVFQHQLNIVRVVWRRLESWRGTQVKPATSLANASSDKLRVLGETLLDILLYTVYEIGPVPSIPLSLCDVFTPSICEAFFHSVCVVTPAPRLQLHAAALLARMAGHQPWWGNFLANTLVNLYSTSSTHIFPQDRVFILLTFLGRKSLIAGANKSSVVDAMVRTLGRLLAPISNGQASSASNGLDTDLVGWVLLFLSVCLDTTSQQFPPVKENSDKNKEQGISSRWEFLQGESAMQRKYVSASRSSASRNYRKKLQKRLMHHKQQMQDLEQAKKVFQTSSPMQAWAAMPAQASTLSNQLEAAFKSQERFFKQTLKQHTSKHFKDIFSIRKNEVQHLSRGSRSHAQSSSSRSEPPDIEFDFMANLSHQNVLPVARGLVALILNNAANVDMFLLACKVVARLVVSTRPAISLGELMSEEQLLRLVRLATGTSDFAWSSHAVSCLLQDLLEGGRLFPRPAPGRESNQPEEGFEAAGAEGGCLGDEDLAAGVAGTSGSSTALGNDEGFAEGDGDEDTQDSTVAPQATPSTSKSNGFNLPSVLESDDSELEDFLDDILERGKNTLKKGTGSKLPTAASSGISLAIDARLEYGIETGVEISLRRLSTLGVYNLPLSINATIQIPADGNRSTQPSPRNTVWSERNPELWNSQETPSGLSMLTRCFDKIFTDFSLQQNSGTSLELVLRLWLTLNLGATVDQSNSTTQFNPSLTPVIPLSSAAISGLISALLWHPAVSLRAWCLALQTLTLASNEQLPSDHAEPSLNSPLDGMVGGMASCIVKDRNVGPMLLRLLSGNGLNVEPRDKQHMMAGPRVGFALQDFLVRLEKRCSVPTSGSPLGNALKELLLWVVYQLVQPGGALVARRGPLDAQCILISSIINVNFTNTDLGTAMSISECVGVLVSSYVRGARGIGAHCGETADPLTQLGSFGGLFSCVFTGGSKQARSTSWDTLVVALIKLVCRLVQTPLPNARMPRTDSTVDMELGEAIQRPGTSSSDTQAKSNTSQTDESKVAEQQTSIRQQQTTAPKPRYPCVADTVLQHEPTMMRLLGALGYSTAFSMHMVFDGAEPELLAYIPDATFELLCTLMKKASNQNLVLNPLYRYLVSSCGQNGPDRQMGVMQLSDPLLRYIQKVLENEESVAIFTAMGGIKVVCENLVNVNNGSSGIGLSSPGVIALVMQHLSNAPNVVPTASTSSKKAIHTLDVGRDDLLNFAPFGTVSWAKPMVEPADVLLQSAAPHKRARTAAWSYHFFPGECSVDLLITLPCAILLKEVELQPHLSSLATCPSAVALEISRESAKFPEDLTPVCPPMSTAGLTSIHVTLSQPEVATSVLVRLYKPRDCTDISLSQIRILGTTAFGEIKSHNETIDEDQLTKTSFSWLRLLHQCLSVNNLSSNLIHDVLDSAASVQGLMEACCSLLLLRPRSYHTSHLEKVLLQLGLHSRELGLQLINLLLNNRHTPLFPGPSYGRKSSTFQLVVEILRQLCSAQDSNTETRVSAVLSWLKESAENAVSRTTTTNVICPPAIYVHCVASIIWKAHENRELTYNLQDLLPDDLFNALYEWTLTLGTYTALKLAIDAALCSLCYVRPSLFPFLLQKVQILVPNLATDRSASISDDRKENEGQTDDRKSETDAEEWYCRLVLPEQKRLKLTEGQLLTVAAAARSRPGVQQLIDSGLPSMLSATILEFCKIEESKQYSGITPEDDRIPSTSNTSMTDSDKAEEAAHQTRNNTSGLCMTEPESIAIVLEFLSLVCSEGRMRDWLGKEGRDFWLPLVSLLSTRPVENPSVSSIRTNVSYGTLESAVIKFLSRCCWCHPENQKLLSELLTNVILQQRTLSDLRYLHGISGFTRRLILQLLLEGEKVLVSVTSDTPIVEGTRASSHNVPSIPPHPAHPLGHYQQLFYMSTQSKVSDILAQVSTVWTLVRPSNSGKGNEASAGSTASGRPEAWENGAALLVDALSVAAGNTAKDKRAKDASNRSQARGPTLRKARFTLEGGAGTSKSSNYTPPNLSTFGSAHYLLHSSPPNLHLLPQLTIAQLLAIAEDNGVNLSDPFLNVILKNRTLNDKDSKDESSKMSESELTTYRSIESTLSVFSAGGGLAVLAKHLPLVYPDSGRPAAFPSAEKSPSPAEQPDADWVKVDASDDTYVDLVEGGTSNSPRAAPPAPHVPLHSLAAFGLFLRLPGYAEVLLRDRKQAQCLLRLALGVTDDGDGGDILSSPIAASLPTLPFQVLKQLLEATPPTTDDGLLLRRTMIEVGAVLLLLNCLAIFTHQTGQNEGSDQRGKTSGTGRSDDKSHLYWAKGTGFGTGSTQQSWNVEQALLRQRSEEEHVTVLLQVLASYVGSGGQPQRELPSTFTDLLARSCLLPALSSYLRNDSVLDMARHIPLYRAILQLLRAMALSSQLAPLLLPRGGRPNDASIVSLLYTMRRCVDAYVYKINCTRRDTTRNVTKYPEDSEQDEGLATLIPDIQESATIVQNATLRLNVIGEELAGPSPTGNDLPLRSVEQRYLEVMKKLQFDTFEIIADNTEGGGYKFAVSYHFESNMRTAGDRSHPARVKRLAQEAVTLSHALPLSYRSSVFVRCDAERLDIMKVLITGPAETPYANGCFEFDVYFPPDYPNSPMLINLETTGRHSVRFNPNLYNDGKVCLSVLNTWQGRPEEKWNAHTSSFLQVLVSIQSLILVPEPYFNEPGYERSRGTPTAAQSSQEYNANICQATVQWAMLDQIKNPCPCFKEVIHTHFWIKRHEIIAQLQGWITEMELHGSDRRSSRSISLNALALRRHFRLLREELNKLPTPEGLEDLVEPLPSPGSPLELSGIPEAPNSPPPPPPPPSSVVSVTTMASNSNSSSSSSVPQSGSNASASNHVHHDIDTDVEMEKMVSKVCE